jgi:hypothetical protein
VVTRNKICCKQRSQVLQVSTRKQKKLKKFVASKIEDRRDNKIKNLPEEEEKKRIKEREREKYQARSRLSRDKQQSLLQSNHNIPSLSRHEHFSPNQTKANAAVVCEIIAGEM